MSTPDTRAKQCNDAGRGSALRVFLITGEPLYREGIESAFCATRSLVLLDGTGLTEAMALAKSSLADLVVIDASNLREALDMAAALAPSSPQVPIVTVSDRATPEDVRSLFDVGVRGCILKGVEGGDFVRILESVGHGTLYLPPELGAGVLRQSMALNGASPQKRSLSRLTPREQQILACVARAQTNKEVARELKISERP
jgi:two-component system, NarL family, nitrate/nitrite response regulator NarL